MSKWYKPLLLSSLLSIPWGAVAHSECDKLFKSSDRTQRQIEFIKARDRLISHFSPEKNATVIAEVIRQSTAASPDKVVKNALWLKDVPREVIRHAEALGLTEERAREVAGEVEVEIDLLENKAICYHFTELEYYDSDRLMLLKLYDDVNVAQDDKSEQPIAFGYFTTTTDGNSSRVVHLTYPGNCGNRKCHFTNIDKDQFKGTGIRLVHHPEVVETMVTPLSSVVNGNPVVTDLTGMELRKTGEIFTSPEIYAAVHYYSEDVDIDKKSFDRRMMVDIPWALEKGSNHGRTRLVSWHNQTKAHIVIMEDDRDIPFGDIQQVIKLGFKAAIEFLPVGGAIINFAEALGRVIDTKDTKGDDRLVALLEGWQKNDYIDELVLKIGFDQDKPQPGIKGNATLQLSNMYAEKEVADEPRTEAVEEVVESSERAEASEATTSGGDQQVPPVDSSSETLPVSSEGTAEDNTGDTEDENIPTDDEEFEDEVETTEPEKDEPGGGSENDEDPEDKKSKTEL